MATCDPQTLLNSANCFDCLSDLQLEQVQVQMLCDLVNVGLAGGPFVRISGDTMTGGLRTTALGIGVNPSIDPQFPFAISAIGSMYMILTPGVATAEVGWQMGRNDGALSFYGGTTFGDGAILYLIGNNHADATEQGSIDIFLGKASSSYRFWDNATEISRWTGGKFGFGTTAPKSKLDIVGNLTVGATYGGVNAAPTSGAIIEGRVGIGTNAPNANALLDLVSTTLGFKLPTMTSAQKGAIANTAGLMVFDTDLGKACVNSGAGWQTITSA